MKQLILAGFLALSACHPVAAAETIDVSFTDADVAFPNGSAVMGCVVDTPDGTNVALLPCSDVAKPVMTSLRKAHPTIVFYVTLNGQRLSEV